MSNPVILIGDGGHASVVYDLLETIGENVIGYTSPEKTNRFDTLSYLGTDEVIKNYKHDEVYLVIGLGDISIRTKIYEIFSKLGYKFLTVIHPTAHISRYASLGEGVQVFAGACVQANSTIKNNVIINTRATIDHDCAIENNVHISPNATLCGVVKVGESCWIGAGSTIRQEIEIGQNSIIGIGSVVTKNIPSNVIAYGVPCKVVKKNE
ncbi:MAG: acetyltransferase [Bacillales bacterium]|jgi:UDP-perosamine 4-acetyltransferase|nr:acetyltransferase [Bacillales bacterium]